MQLALNLGFILQEIIYGELSYLQTAYCIQILFHFVACNILNIVHTSVYYWTLAISTHRRAFVSPLFSAFLIYSHLVSHIMVSMATYDGLST